MVANGFYAVRMKRGAALVIQQSTSTTYPVGHIVTAMNGVVTMHMTQEQMHDILTIPLDREATTLSLVAYKASVRVENTAQNTVGRCITANGFYASRHRTGGLLTIVQSTSTSYPLGHIVTAINDTACAEMTREQVDDQLSTPIMSAVISSLSDYRQSRRRRLAETAEHAVAELAATVAEHAVAELAATVGRCITANGFYASRHRTGDLLTIVQSTSTSYPLGHIVTAINETACAETTREQVDDQLSTPIMSAVISSLSDYRQSRRWQLAETAELAATVSRCITANGFYASRQRTGGMLTIVQSTSTSYPLGHIVPAINETACAEMTREQVDDQLSTPIMSAVISSLSDYRQSRRRQLAETSASRTGTSADNVQSSTDAENYAAALDSLTKFVTCAVCGVEEGPKTMVSLTNPSLKILNGLQVIKSKFDEVLDDLRGELGSEYDRTFADVLATQLPNGILAQQTHICKSCVNKLPKLPRQNPAPLTMEYAAEDVSDMESGGSDDDESDSSEDEAELTPDVEVEASVPTVPNAQTRDGIPLPKAAMICGMYQGTIPKELQELTLVEQSMISIYSAVSKVSLMGGKHYRVKGATTYTIVNNLAGIAKQLPRMPSVAEFAILRAATQEAAVDNNITGPADQTPSRAARRVTPRKYTFRPRKVRDALIWLKHNNHLYESVEIIWPGDEGYWTDDSEQEVPAIELSPEDVVDIDTVLDSNYGTDSAAQLDNEDREVLLITHADADSTEEILQTNTGQPSAIIQRPPLEGFASPYRNPEFFLAKCFPVLYPYGRGCPYDRTTDIKTFARHAALMLKRAGGKQGRRYQQCPE
jgi:primosomal replication protein N